MSKTLQDLAEEYHLDNICLVCDIYNSFGCINKKGNILCKTREYLIKKLKEKLNEIPYNWRREIIYEEFEK